MALSKAITRRTTARAAGLLPHLALGIGVDAVSADVLEEHSNHFTVPQTSVQHDSSTVVARMAAMPA
jgi:hypothetical protein